MSNADGWPYDRAAGPVSIALFDGDSFGSTGVSNAVDWPCDSAIGPVSIALLDLRRFESPGDVKR